MSDETDGFEAYLDFGAKGGESDCVGAAPPTDALYRVLANPIRRRVLRYLQEHSRATRGELADTLADPEPRAQIELGLHHVHLPALADVGLVAFNAGDGTVELRSLAKWTRDVIWLVHRYDRIGDAERRLDDPTVEPDDSLERER